MSFPEGMGHVMECEGRAFWDSTIVPVQGKNEYWLIKIQLHSSRHKAR